MSQKDILYLQGLSATIESLRRKMNRGLYWANDFINECAFWRTDMMAKNFQKKSEIEWLELRRDNLQKMINRKYEAAINQHLCKDVSGIVASYF